MTAAIPTANRTTFSDRFTRRMARRYRRHGLSSTQERLAGFLTERGIEGASGLEIGGGVGEIQVELLRRGASSVTNLEISTSYEKETSELLERSGMTGRVQRRLRSNDFRICAPAGRDGRGRAAAGTYTPVWTSWSVLGRGGSRALMGHPGTQPAALSSRNAAL